MATIKNVSDQALARIANYFRALADPNRLRIVRALMDRECNVGELVELLGGSQANVSKHVGVLVDAGILARRQRGTFTFLCIADPDIHQLCDVVCGSVGRSIDRDLGLREELVRTPAARGATRSPGRRS
jgi:DNA-binding transcriptional ArsR family regulator